MTVALIMIDDTGTIVFWNELASEFFGHEPNDVVGRNIELLDPDEYVERHREGMQRAMSGGERHLEGAATHLPVRHADGSVVTHPARFNHISSPTGMLVAAAASFGPSRPDSEPWSPIDDE